VTAFTDKVAVITGASSGIGKAIATGLADKGATLCLVGRNIEALAKVAEDARLPSARGFSYQVDLTIDENLRELTRDLQRDFEYIDMLIHSAGVISHGPVETARIDDLDWQYRTNTRAPYLLTQFLLPLLRPRRGQIVFINSLAVLRAVANSGQYCATKFALKAIADSLRLEVNKDGIRVITVYPGRTATPMQATIFETETGRKYDSELLMQPADIAVTVINSLLLPRSAEVTEIFMRPMNKY